MRRLLFLTGLLFTIVAVASCGSTRQAILFNNDDRSDSMVRTETIGNDFQTIIQKDDILAINVSSISSITPESDPVRVFREGGTQFNILAAQGGSSSNPGFLVDEEGFIDYPLLGKVKVAGLSIRQAKDVLIQRLKLYVKEPVVEVRIINYKVVVLGEVNRPGTLIAPNHKISILDAIAASGDISVYGRRDNVLVIRQSGGQRIEARINLNSRDAFHSPYYYLQQNDVVYVEPGVVRRQATNNFTQVYLPIISGLLSLTLTTIGFILFTRRDNQ